MAAEITKENLSVDEFYNERKPISMQTHEADMEFIDKVDIILSQIFRKKNYQHLRTPLMFIFRELITNANKANMKRVFFKLNGLDINNPAEYEKGMQEFSEQVRNDNGKITSYLERYKVFVKVLFQEYADRQFTVYILNSGELLPREKERILEKIKHFNDDADGADILDMTEGAGMGIMLSLKLMEQVGISSEALTLGVHKGMTVAKFSFDYTSIHAAPYNVIAEEILKIVNTLPKYPDNIKNLLAKLLQPDIKVQDVAEEISKDPSLSSDLLKLVNSAKFSLQRKIGSIKEAINFVGIKGLKNLLYSYGAMQAIDSRFGSVNQVWEHSYKTARVASLIAERFKLNKKDDESFTAGLLHDMGKIVLMSFDLNKAKSIDEVCRQRGIDLPVMEELIMGLSHAKIGGEIAKYWDFPSSLISAITYHHEPIMAETDHELVYTVNLANYIASVKNKSELNAYLIEPDVRDFFKINSTYDIVKFAETLGSY